MLLYTDVSVIDLCMLFYVWFWDAVIYTAIFAGAMLKFNDVGVIDSESFLYGIIIECFEVGVLLILIVATWLREFMELLYSVFRGLCFHSYFLLRQLRK